MRLQGKDVSLSIDTSRKGKHLRFKNKNTTARDLERELLAILCRFGPTVPAVGSSKECKCPQDGNERNWLQMMQRRKDAVDCSLAERSPLGTSSYLKGGTHA